MKKLLSVVASSFAALFMSLGVAHGDIGGSVPSPGGCSYPGIGIFGAEFGAYHQGCQFPVEINGTRWTTLFGGGMWQVQAGASFNVFFLNVAVSVTTPTGVLEGINYWACPNGSMGEQPNPPGAWKNPITPSRTCKELAPKPVLITDPPPPPMGAPMPPPTPTDGVSPPVYVAPPPNPISGAVTDPVRGNPDATEDPSS